MSISRDYFQKPSLDYILLGNQGARDFEIILIANFAVDIGNKNIAGKYLKNSCIRVTRPGQLTQGAISIIPWFI